MKKKLVPLSRTVVKAGEPLLYPVFRNDGTLLASKGLVLTHSQTATILEEELYTHAYELTSAVVQTQPREDFIETHKLASPFLRMRQAEEMLQEIYIKPNHPTNMSKLLTIIGRIQMICQQAADAAIAKIFIENIDNYAVQHALHTAILCNLTAEYLRWDKEDIKNLIGAAITMNFSLGMKQNDYHQQSEPLTPEQKLEIANHPGESLKALKAVGIQQKKWLEFVEKHHESIDGTGYPNKLTSKDIPLGASMLKLADVYCAKITGRTYRSPIIPSVAARDIFMEKTNDGTSSLIQIFVKIVGLYPPGCLVKLTSNEIGIVTRRGARVDTPVVRAIFTANGAQIATPLLRNTEQKAYIVKEIVEMGYIRPDLDLERFWT